MKLEIDYKKLKTGLKKKTINPAEVTELTIYDFHSVSDLTFLDGMVNLRRFDAGMRWGKDLDFSRITACKNIEELDFNNDNTTDLSWLAGLPKLRVLDVTGSDLDYNTLPPMPQIEFLHFGDEYSKAELPDYSILKRFPNLRGLLVGLKHQKNLGFLEYFPKLESLAISDSYDYETKSCALVDISHLGCCPNLLELVVIHCDAVDDIAAIGKLTKLRKLKLYHVGRNNKKASILPIASLTNLEYLELDEAGTMNGYAKLAALTKLQHFKLNCLYNQKLPDIDFIGGWVNLRYLSIPGQRFIKSLEPLRNLTELDYLELSDTNEKLTDFTPLNALKKLRECIWLACPKGKCLLEIKSPVLTKLTIGSVKYAENLTCISHLTGIEELSARYANIKSTQGTESLTKLREADFTGCAKLMELDGVSSCAALESITISECKKLDDLSVLKKNKALKSLTMYQTRADLNTLPRRKGLEIKS